MHNPNSGVYALRHKPSGHVYFGSTTNFKSRRKKWWATLAKDPQNLSPSFKRLFPYTRSDWEFILVKDGTGMTTADLVEAEAQAIVHARQRAITKVLNEVPVQRPDLAGFTAAGRTQPLNAWARETGIPRATITARMRSGWTPEEVVGLAERAPRDHRTEHQSASINFSRVVVVDGERPLLQWEAANLLGCSVKSLQKRLVRYRTSDSQTTVQLAHLQHLTTKYRADR